MLFLVMAVKSVMRVKCYVLLYYQGDINSAISQFDNILDLYPTSPRAQFGKAQALNALAERRQSNTVLEQAIGECLKVLALDDVPRQLFIKAGTLCADRQSFRGTVFILELQPCDFFSVSSVAVLHFIFILFCIFYFVCFIFIQRFDNTLFFGCCVINYNL